MNLLQHILLIPDGNRRWARKRGLPSFQGHREGARIIGKILEAALNFKIPCFTFWGASLDNITKRSASEVNFLFRIFESYFKKLLKEKKIYRNGVKVEVLGRWNKFFPEKVRKPIEEIIEKTKNHKNYKLTFLLAYSGIDEMTSAIQRIAKIKNQKSLMQSRSPESQAKINEELIKKNLWTRDLPPVDLIIRTGSERDNWTHFSSGLMMWDIANAQMYLTKTLFPDFSVKEFEKAVQKYGRTERRMGK